MYDTAHKKLGATIRRLRKAKGLSQEGFAQIANIERARYGRMERGELNITLSALFALANELGVTPSELLSDLSLDDCRANVGP